MEALLVGTKIIRRMVHVELGAHMKNLTTKEGLC